MAFQLSVFSQKIKGTIKTSNGKAIQNATILVKSDKNSSDFQEFFIGNEDGNYSFELTNNYLDIIYLEFTAFNFSIHQDSINNPKKNKLYEFNIVLEEKNQILKEVIISETKRFEQRGDTTVYFIKAYKDGTERNVEDILRKLPGIEVNDDDGTLKYLGKQVEAVQLDGDDLFGYRYSTATKNISADMIEKVEAIDHFNSNPLLKGMEESKTTALNLTLKKGKLDWSKNEYIGIGGGNKLMLDIALDVIAVSPKSKSFANLSYNNIGLNSSPFNFFNTSSNPSIDEIISAPPKLINNKSQNSILSEKRSNVNEQKNSSINTIYKLNSLWSLRANLFYLQDKLWNEEYSLQQFSVQQQMTEYKDKNTSVKTPLNQQMELKLVHNLGRSRHFEWQANLGDLEIINNIDFSKNGQIPTKTSLLTRDFLWSQKIDFSQKYRENLFQFIAQNYQNSTPQIFRPIQNFSFTGNMYAFSNLQSSHFTKNSSIYNLKWFRKFSKFRMQLVSKFQTESLKYRSFLEENDYKVNEFINDNIYRKSKLSQQVIFNYDQKKWKFIFDLNANKWIQNFTSPSNSLPNHHVSSFVGYHLDIFNDYSNDMKIMFTWKLDRNPVGENHLFSQQVVHQNRGTIQNQISLDLVENQQISLGFRKDNLSKSINQSLIFSYLKTKNSFISNLTINENFTQTVYYQSPKNIQFINCNYTFDKYIYELKWNLNHSSNIGWGSNFNEINMTGLSENQQFSYLGSFAIRTMRKRIFDVENKLTYQFFEFKRPENENINTSINNSFKLIFHPLNNYSAWLIWEHFRPNLNEKTSFSFLDFKIEKKLKSTQPIKIALLGKNVLNQSYFTQIANTSYSTQIFQSSLLPGYWMLTTNLEF